LHTDKGYLDLQSCWIRYRKGFPDRHPEDQDGPGRCRRTILHGSADTRFQGRPHSDLG
jgi:hypothetical protein